MVTELHLSNNLHHVRVHQKESVAPHRHVITGKQKCGGVDMQSDHSLKECYFVYPVATSLALPPIVVPSSIVKLISKRV